MNVPESLEEMDSYCDRVLELLGKWKWLFRCRTTDLLLGDTLTSEYLTILEELDNDSLNQLPCGYIQDSWPDDLIHFVNECEHLSFNIANYEQPPLKVPNKLKRCISQKKEHEIDKLAGYMIEQCLMDNISMICDIGSGLGYIDRLIASLSRVRVIGIECDQTKINTAIRLNIGLLDSETCSKISYVHCRLTSDSLEWTAERLEDLCQGQKCGLVGLHACGDLSPLTLRLFLSVTDIKTIILLPCCYHKMLKSESFPTSDLLRGKLAERKGNLINSTLLRLASESTRERWVHQTEKEHMQHSFCVLARAVVQLFLIKNNYKTWRLGRRANINQHKLEWASYVSMWLDRNCVTDENDAAVSKERVQEELLALWPEHSHLARRTEAYTALLVCLQGAVERLLLVDKLAMLRESGQMDVVKAVRIADSALSPRSIALVGTKVAQ